MARDMDNDGSQPVAHPIIQDSTTFSEHKNCSPRNKEIVAYYPPTTNIMIRYNPSLLTLFLARNENHQPREKPEIA